MPSSFRHNISRHVVATLGCIAALAFSSVHAQTSAPELVTNDTLAYYLYQAFEAPLAEQRKPLNHIGIEISLEDGAYLVTAALEGYPAHLAGLLRGDRILRVNGEPYHPIDSFNERDPQSKDYARATGSFEIEYERQGEPASIQIQPVFENLYDSYRSATLSSAQVFPLGNKMIAYLRLWGLSRSTADLFALDSLMESFTDSDGMILDMRNSYGYLSRAHLDMFARNGRGYFEATGEASPHIDIGPGVTDPTRPFTKPIVILLNSQTRAGAELLAHGLSKLGRISTMGSTSAGTLGTYSEDGTAMHYTRSPQIRIDDAPFEGIGVVPDQSIPFPFSQSGRSDPQFEAAVDFLLGRI